MRRSKISWYQKQLLVQTNQILHQQTTNYPQTTNQQQTANQLQTSSQLQTYQLAVLNSCSKNQQARKQLPFIFKYFYLVQPGKARCCICENQKDAKIDFSVANSHFQNAEKHLARQHSIVNPASIQKKKHFALKRSLANQTIQATNPIPKDNPKHNSTPKHSSHDDSVEMLVTHKRSRFSAHVFNYFTRINSQFVRCNLCNSEGRGAIYSIKFSAFKNCIGHLQRQHSIFLNAKQSEMVPKQIQTSTYKSKYLYGSEAEEQDDANDDKSKLEIRNRKGEDNRVKKKYPCRTPSKFRHLIHKYKYGITPSQLITQLICQQRVPLQTLDSHPFFRQTFTHISTSKFNAPVANILTAQFSTQKQLTSRLIQQKRASGFKFALSMSKVTIADCPCLVLCVHCEPGIYFCVGIVRIKQTLQLEAIQRTIIHKIAQFGIDWQEDIICILRGGNSTNTIENWPLSKPQLTCLHTTIQAYLISALYKEHDVCELQLCQQQVQLEEDYIDELMQEYPDEGDCQFRDEGLARAVTRVRQVVCTLYEGVRTGSGVEQGGVLPADNICLDVRCNWQSLLHMLANHVEARDQRKQFLKQMGCRLTLTPQQDHQIGNLLRVLQSIRTYLQAINNPATTITQSLQHLRHLRLSLVGIQSDLACQLEKFVLEQQQQINRLLFDLMHDHRTAAIKDGGNNVFGHAKTDMLGRATQNSNSFAIQEITDLIWATPILSHIMVKYNNPVAHIYTHVDQSSHQKVSLLNEVRCVPVSLSGVCRVASRFRTYATPEQSAADLLQCIVALAINLQSGVGGHVHQSNTQPIQ